jgi:hypothetical protein
MSSPKGFPFECVQSFSLSFQGRRAGSEVGTRPEVLTEALTARLHSRRGATGSKSIEKLYEDRPERQYRNIFGKCYAGLQQGFVALLTSVHVRLASSVLRTIGSETPCVIGSTSGRIPHAVMCNKKLRLRVPVQAKISNKTARNKETLSLERKPQPGELQRPFW